jgi:hypothetical protein
MMASIYPCHLKMRVPPCEVLKLIDYEFVELLENRYRKYLKLKPIALNMEQVNMSPL